MSTVSIDPPEGTMPETGCTRKTLLVASHLKCPSALPALDILIVSIVSMFVVSSPNWNLTSVLDRSSLTFWIFALT